ncbi:hypothetical protein [Microbispora sp. NPDC049633]|uniref:hypothetical protein n=1 Tax=Microbispora sp. NPDC049633 TaxID=3154355 RepID=UPI003444F172
MWHNRETLDQAVELAEKVAEHLDGYEAFIRRDDYTTTIELVKDGIFRLSFYQLYNDKGRARITGVLPHDPHGDVWGIEGGEITVSMTRDPKAVAKDIARRLVSEYEPNVEQALIKIANGDKRRNQLDELIDDLTGRIPGATKYGAADRRAVRLPYQHSTDDRDKNLNGDIEISSGGYAHVAIRTENVAFLRDLADLIAKYQD